MLKLKDEGNRLFGRKEYQKALEAYDRALRMTGADARDDLALLHSNKAACYMMFQRCSHTYATLFSAQPGMVSKLFRLQGQTNGLSGLV